MLHTIREEIATLDTSPRALRQFGLVVGGVFAAIAAVLAWQSGWALGPWPLGLGGLGGLLVLLGLVAPRTLRLAYRLWMGLAVVLGYVMTRVLLTAVFALVVLPIGLALRVIGKELLERRPDGETTSYWKPKAYADPSPKRLEKYY